LHKPMSRMRVEFLLKTDSGYPKDAGVILHIDVSNFIKLHKPFIQVQR